MKGLIETRKRIERWKKDVEAVLTTTKTPYWISRLEALNSVLTILNEEITAEANRLQKEIYAATSGFKDPA